MRVYRPRAGLGRLSRLGWVVLLVLGLLAGAILLTVWH
jgi:hypothetical protein